MSQAKRDMSERKVEATSRQKASNEKKHWLFRVGDEILPNYVVNKNKPFNKGPYKTTSIMESTAGFFGGSFGVFWKIHADF